MKEQISSQAFPLFAPYTPPYWEEWAASWRSIGEKMNGALACPPKSKALQLLEPLQKTLLQDFHDVNTEILASFFKNPFTALQKAQAYGAQQAALLWDLGDQLCARQEDNRSPSPFDKRFKAKTWEKNLFWNYLKKFYLAQEAHSYKTLQDLPLKESSQKKRVEFIISQLFHLFSPANFPNTNPLVWEKIQETGGLNLVKGLKNFLKDLQKGQGLLKIPMTDAHPFEVGKTLACTPGSVIFQNDLMQLIYYQPQGETVFQIPLLIIPPWINKYYVLDLQPHNSFVRWAVEKGYQVFMISWVNPDKNHATKTFEDYMKEGPLEALRVIHQYFQAPGVNLLGYCLGGTLLACTLAYLSQKKSPLPIKSATFLTTLIDFQTKGDLGVFIEENILSGLESQMAQKGYLDGEILATTFNFLKSQDLFWSFFEKNYLLGERPGPFDLLYWNSDPTRLPYEMQQFYLRQMYQNNLLSQPGGITLDGVPLNLHEVSTPVFMVSTKEDHIAPWKGTYKATQIFKNIQRFILGGSGHVAGIINPPTPEKYGYWENTSFLPTPDEWMASATHFPGSWWTAWEEWLTPYKGQVVSPQTMVRHPFSPLETAPGSYVKAR